MLIVIPHKCIILIVTFFFIVVIFIVNMHEEFFWNLNLLSQYLNFKILNICIIVLERKSPY